MKTTLSLKVLGTNGTLLWGLDSATRIARMASAQGMTVSAANAPVSLIANARFAFDPAWVRHIAAQPGRVLTCQNQVVLAHVTNPAQQAAVETHLATGAPLAADGLLVIAAETSGTIEDPVLRKREQPFVQPLTPETLRSLERASYFGAYKGVTDVLTKYLWPEWALVLTRIAARLGLSPNMVTTIGLAFCIAAGVAFYKGQYWLGLLTGLVSMVLDTVDGKLARCTITSSAWGNIYDHGIDLIHPPIWWWAWGVGLAAYGTPLSATVMWLCLVAIVGGYVVQRIIEGAFIGGFKMHIHVWQRIDSQFRLITARRNPNWVILLAALAVGRPDWGLIALAWWTALSCLFHLVRLGQAYACKARGQVVVSWLTGPEAA